MKEVRTVLIFLGIALSIFFINPGVALPADVDVQVGINVPLPPLVLPAPPAVILIPGTYAYFAPDVDVDIIFFHGYWYRPYGRVWYRAGDYNGPWVTIDIDRVPGVLIKLPPDFRRVPPGHQRIPYGQLKGNWKKWESDKHWDKPAKELRKEVKEPKKEMREPKRKEMREPKGEKGDFKGEKKEGKEFKKDTGKSKGKGKDK